MAPPTAIDSVPATGLTAAEAARRLARTGPNTLPEPPRPSFARRLGDQVASPLVGLLGVAGVLSVALGQRVEAAIILAIVALNAVLGALEERRADSAARALRDTLRVRAVVERDGVPGQVDVAAIVPGDLVVLDAGDRVPADGRIVEARRLMLDESVLTGESLPAARTDGMLRSGTTVVRGLARMAVTATGAATELGAIVGAATRPPPPTPLERRLARLVALLLRAGAALCLGLAALAWAYGEHPADALLTGVALAVAAMPEGLPAVVSITLALGVRDMARCGAIVRRLNAVEALGSATVICADKTGTLTANRMAVVAVLGADGTQAAPGDGSASVVRAVLPVAALACEAPLGAGADAPDVEPTERAVLAAAAAAGAERQLADAGVAVAEVEPFDSVQRSVSALVRGPGGRAEWWVKGAPETLLDLVEDAAVADRMRAAAERWAADGLRVLLVGVRAAGPDGDPAAAGPLVVRGLLGLSDPPRPGVAEDVAQARAAGVRTIMVTGDHPVTALAIARRVGIADGDATVATGDALAALDEEALRRLLRDTTVIARVRPEQKLRIVEALRADGEVVAMTGDGVNDVPALRAADIGVAMGDRGSDAAAEAAAMVLADDHYGTIVRAIEQGRRIYDDVVRAVHFLLAANLGEVLVFALAIPLGLGAPLTVLQILLVNLLTDGPPAVALSADPPEQGVMRRPPRPLREGLLDPIRARLLGAGVATGLCGFAAFLLGRADGDDQARTMAFITLVAAQLLHVLSVRGDDVPWRAGRNRALGLALALSAAAGALVLVVPALADAFAVAPLSAAQLAAALLLACGPLAVGEAIKAAARRRVRPPTR
jgi:Ca2+-transporting ATPase